MQCTDADPSLAFRGLNRDRGSIGYFQTEPSFHIFNSTIRALPPFE